MRAPPPRLSCTRRICTKAAAGSCQLCDALDEADQFTRRWLYGGWLCESLDLFLKMLAWVCRPFKDSFRIFELIAVLIAITAFFLDVRYRHKEQEARAWQLLVNKTAGNSGKVLALEYLNSEQIWPPIPKWWPLLQIRRRESEITESRRIWVLLQIKGKKSDGDHKIWAIENLDREEGETIPPKWWPLNKSRMPLHGINLTLPGNDKTDGACQERAYLRNVKIPNANLTSANLECSDLQGADLKKANLQGANLQGVKFAPEFDEDLSFYRGADGSTMINDLLLSKGDGLRKVGLLGANLQGADLRAAKLKGAIFAPSSSDSSRNVHDSSPNFLGFRLLNFLRLFDRFTVELSPFFKADLLGADLRGAQDIDCEKLKGAKHWETTYRDSSLECGRPIPKP